MLAIKLERELTKDQILERYLNTIYFGRGAYGVGASRPRLLRPRPVADHTAGGGLPRRAHPITGDGRRRHRPEQAQFRRHSVLAAMLGRGKITQAQFDAADKVPMPPMASAPRGHRRLRAPAHGEGERRR